MCVCVMSCGVCGMSCVRVCHDDKDELLSQSEGVTLASFDIFEDWIQLHEFLPWCVRAPVIVVIVVVIVVIVVAPRLHEFLPW